MIKTEKEIQDLVTEKLNRLDLFPFSVIFTRSISDGLLSITFYIPQQLEDLLEILEYKTRCDKSGFIIFKESCTILFSGLALDSFLNL